MYNIYIHIYEDRCVCVCSEDASIGPSIKQVRVCDRLGLAIIVQRHWFLSRNTP